MARKYPHVVNLELSSTDFALLKAAKETLVAHSMADVLRHLIRFQATQPDKVPPMHIKVEVKKPLQVKYATYDAYMTSCKLNGFEKYALTEPQWKVCVDTLIDPPDGVSTFDLDRSHPARRLIATLGLEEIK